MAIANGARRAEYLEIVLFVCPHCHEMNRLRSNRHRFACDNCGYAVHYDLYGFFRARSGRLYFETIRQWNQWQIGWFRHAITTAIIAIIANGASPNPLLHEPRIILTTGYKSRPVQKIGDGSLELYHDRLLVRANDATEILCCPLAEIEGINVQIGERLEFYWRSTLYRIGIPDPRGNTYKWDLAIKTIRDHPR